MCYLNSRYYDPTVGRFLSPDSLEYLEPEYLGGLNLYSYCNNNPVNYYDPSGHFIALLIASIVGFAVLGGVAAGLTAYENRASGWGIFGSALLGTLFGGAIGALAGLAMGFIGPAIGGLGAMLFGDVMAMSGAMALVGVLAQLGVVAGAIYVTAAGATALGNIMFSKWEPGSWPGDDPTVSPGDGFEWRGPSEVGGPHGDWYNSTTGDQLHPDLNHPLPKGPHWGWRNKLKRIFKDIFRV